jgi:hypothetical protein
MADEKKPAHDAGSSKSGTDATEDGASPESPWGEAASDADLNDAATSGPVGAVAAADEEKPGWRWRGRGGIVVLAFLGLLVVGLYLSWPLLQSRLFPPASPPQVPQAAQTLAAVEALDLRVARLEAAEGRRDKAANEIKSAMAAFTAQLDDLSQGLSGGEVLASLRGKLAEMETAVDQLGQKAGENGAAALAAMGAEVNALKARLGDLASGAARPGSASGTAETGTREPVPTQEEVTALAGQTAVLARQAAALTADNKELRQTVAALRARLDQLQGAVRQSVAAGRKAGTGQGLVLAVGQLRQTVLAGAPYTATLADVTALAGDDVALQRPARALAPMAGTGVASLRALSDQFAAMTGAVLRADSKEADSFWRRTLHRVTSLVTVRRVGEVDGMETDAILARAERRLAAGDLAAAASLIEGLAGPAAQPARPWLDRAKARLAAMDALAELQSRAIAQLAGG